MIFTFGDFPQFSSEKMAIFWKTSYDPILCPNSTTLIQKAADFLQFFREKILKIEIPVSGNVAWRLTTF
jgi:hypothetical protein